MFQHQTRKIIHNLGKIPIIKDQMGDCLRSHEPVAFVSFPKCGRTWVRVMLGKVLQDLYEDHETPLLQMVDYHKSRPDFQGINWVHDDLAHWKKPAELQESKSGYLLRKVIFLARDPRDVMVSVYFEKRNRLKLYMELESKSELKGRIKPFEGSLSDYLNQTAGGMETLCRFYKIWENALNGHPSNIIVRYEDLKKDACKELRRMADFIGLNRVSDQMIKDAVDYAEFSKMQKMEKDNKFKSFKLQAADPDDKESFKTRKGKVGGYVEYMTSEEIERLTTQMHSILKGAFGY